MYQRIGKAAYKTDLKNTIGLCKLLGNPEKKFRSIHIAGTNGKGSTSHMLSSILQEAGYKVGLYTSPHLKDFRERIKINGEMISEGEVVAFVDSYNQDFDRIQLSFFEWTVGLAFDYFASQKVDIAIIETGMGGRLDSTNVVIPEVSVITNIGLDHTQFLGDTLSKIAIEKAGIIKAGIPVIIGEHQKEIEQIFISKAKLLKCRIEFASDCPSLNYDCDLKGAYQKANVKTAVVATRRLVECGWRITDQNIKDGLTKVVKNTGLMGRWQIINEKPLSICDTGHNESGIKYVVDQLDTLSYKKLHIVLGMVSDKSIENILALLPKEAIYYFCKVNLPRAFDTGLLKKQAQLYGLVGENYDSVLSAYNSALQNADKEDMIFIGGSTFVVAEVL